MKRVFGIINSVAKNKLIRFASLATAAVGIIAVNIFSATPAAACHCNSLDIKQINRDTFSFTGQIDNLGGGQITKMVYEFGDGTSETATNDTPVVHKYTEAGSFKARVTIFWTKDGETRELSGPACNKPIEVKPLPPVFACSALEAEQTEVDTYYFTAKAQAQNGAEFKSVDFDFGDGNKALNVKPTSEHPAGIGHQYKKDGNYKITATLHFMVGDEIKDVTCTKTISFKVDMCEFNSALPKNSPNCKKPETPPTPSTPQTPNAPQPQPELPKALPATGAADLLGGGIGLGGIVAAGTHYVRARRNFKNLR